MDKKEKKRVFQSAIIALCLFPLFFYIAFVVFMIPFLLLIVHLVAGSAAFVLFLLYFQWNQTKQYWFWGLMAFSSPGLVIFFFLGRYIPSLMFLMLPCLLIQFLFPAIHLILEMRGNKPFFMKVLLCIYVFSLVIGCTILFLEKESHFEFFPIAALSGILLEIFALREKLKDTNVHP